VRIRSVKPEFWRDDVTGVMAPDVALFYVGVCCYADDHGRFEWNPVLLRADIDPYDAKFGGVKGIAKLLENLRTLKRIVRYEVEGRAYGHIPSFRTHQSPKNPSNPRCPLPPEYGDSPAPLLPQDASTTGRGGGEGEGEGRGDGKGEVAGSADASPPSPAAATLPCVGDGPSEFVVTEEQVAAWRPAYPAVDVLGEIRKARAWLDANPSKRKTHRGCPAFLVRWLSRSQDGGGSRERPPPRIVTAPASPSTAFAGGRREL
jgi:hypothetical protein